MNKLTIAALVLIISMSCLSASAQTDAEMKAMMAYATPGDMHAMLAKYTGSYTCTVTMWMEPGAAASVSNAEAKNEMILGGRYLQGTNSGSFNGMPFQGISITGYDNAKKLFVNTWIDNMGTGIMSLTGTWDAASNSIKFSGNMVDPGTGKDIPVKETLKFVDDKTMVLAMYYNNAGKEFKTMEVKYVKQ